VYVAEANIRYFFFLQSDKSDCNRKNKLKTSIAVHFSELFIKTRMRIWLESHLSNSFATKRNWVCKDMSALKKQPSVGETLGAILFLNQRAGENPLKGSKLISM